jgi:16S rRNA (cytidine1402-2'-O)-methyltransferase
MANASTVYLIPSLLDEEAIETIPPYIIDAVKNCQAFFVENEKTARRFLKKIWKEMVIDDYKWYRISDHSQLTRTFRSLLSEGKNIGIISDAGCPGVADPGQSLIAIAQEMKAKVKPLVGPSSILLALMASGMNGQQFQFIGYLPVKEAERIKAIRQLELESEKKNCTQVFIETPYRNNQLIETILKTCKGSTKFCIAADITSPNESISTMTINDWKKNRPELHKHVVIFLIYAGSSSTKTILR